MFSIQDNLIDLLFHINCCVQGGLGYGSCYFVDVNCLAGSRVYVWGICSKFFAFVRDSEIMFLVALILENFSVFLIWAVNIWKAFRKSSPV